jgi:hypothetical protein
VRFDLSGGAEAVGGRLRVWVDVVNRAESPVFDLLVDGELAGGFAKAPLDETLAPGERGRVELSFPPRVPRPGLHALILHVDFRTGEPPAPKDTTRSSQLGFLLLPLGGQPPPALALRVQPGEVVFRGQSRVELESLDGVDHTIQLRVHTARGLAAHPRELELALPGGGKTAVDVELLRSSAPDDTRHGILVEARVLDGPLSRTAVSVGVVDVRRRPNRVRSLARPLLAVAAAAVVAALLLEIRGRR